MKTLLTILLVTIAANLQLPAPPAKWQNPNSWRMIKPGISPDHASRLLGDPAEIDASNAIEAWYYGGKTDHPKDAVLVFSNQSNKLQKVIPPDWSSMPSWAEAQADYRKSLSEYRAALSEQKRLASEAANTQLATERAERSKNTKPSGQIIIRPNTTENNQSTTANRPSRPDPDAAASRYMISIGIGMIVFAIIIAASRGYRYFTSK